MAIPITLEQYLADHHAEFEVVAHPKSSSSLSTAWAAHIPGDRIAKSVILEDEKGYLMAVLPATHRVEIGALSRLTGRRLGLATEPELLELFPDCELGAVPPLGDAYGVETLWDNSVVAMPEVYFEAGDHEELLHMTNLQFRKLIQDDRHGDFSHPE